MKLKHHFLIIILSIFLTAVFTWPFISKLNSFYYDDGEYQLSGSIMAYNAQAILSGKIFDRNSYFNGFQFYPQPYTLAYTDLRLLPSFIFTPIFIVTQSIIPKVNALILSANLVTLLSFVLSLITSFYAIYYFSKNPPASLIGAIIFTFNPITFSKMPEHFEYLHKYLLPLVFLFAYKFFTKPSLKSSLIFFLVLTLNAFSTVYYQIFTLITVPFFALPFLISNFFKKETKYFLKLLSYSFIFLIFLPVLLYFNLPYLEFSQKENVSRSFTENIFFSARLIDYVSPSPNNWLYSTYVKNIDEFRAPKDINGEFNYLEHSLSLNIIPFFFFVIFIFSFFKKNGEKTKNMVVFSYGIFLLVTFTLTLGPYFQGWSNSESDIKSPFYFLYQYFPLLKGIRVPTRAQFLFYVPFSLFVAYGASLLFSKFDKIGKKFIYLITTVILIGLFMESFTPSAIGRPYDITSNSLEEVSQIYQEWKSLNFLKDKETLHIPVLAKEPGKIAYFLNWASISGERMVNGNWGSFAPTSQHELLNNLEEGLDENNLKDLKIMGVDFIIFHKNLLKEKQQKDMKFVKLFPESVMYENDSVLIIDLNKLNINFNLCNFNSDIVVGIQKGYIPTSLRNFYMAQLENKSDCYYPSIYLDKYKEVVITQKDLFGSNVKKIFFLTLPPLISPYSKIMLSEINNNLKVEY